MKLFDSPTYVDFKKLQLNCKIAYGNSRKEKGIKGNERERTKKRETWRELLIFGTGFT